MLKTAFSNTGSLAQAAALRSTHRLAILVLSSLIASCGSGSDQSAIADATEPAPTPDAGLGNPNPSTPGSGPAPVEGAQEIKFYSETSNPYLLSLTPKATVPMTFLGSRDTDGTVRSLSGLALNASADQPAHTELDSTGRPTRTTLDDGTLMTFTWTGPRKAVVTILSADGKEQSTASVDLDQLSARDASLSGVPLFEKSLRIRRGEMPDLGAVRK